MRTRWTTGQYSRTTNISRWSAGFEKASPSLVWGVSNKLAFPGKSGKVFPLRWIKASCDAKVIFGKPICWIKFSGKTSSFDCLRTIGKMLVTVLQTDTGRLV